MLDHKISLILITVTAISITLALAQPGLAGPLFSSPIPPPTGGEAIWCADIEATFTPGPGAGEMSFVATLTNTTYVTTPVAYPLNIPEDRVQVGVWQEQRRRQTNTGYLFPVPATAYGATSVVAGTFPAPDTGSPVRYSLRLWDNVDRVWGRTDCEPPPEVVNPPAEQPPPPLPLTPASGSWQTSYDPITFTWQPPVLADGVPPVLDYELQITWGDGTTNLMTTTLTQTTVALPAAVDQPISWQVRARNSAGYGRFSEPARDYGIDATPPALAPIVETHGVLSGTWQNMVSTPVFTWAGSDPVWSSGLGYLMDWTTTLPCAPSALTTTTTYSTPASGINYLCVQARDGAGNRSQVETFEFRYDPPGVSLDLTPALAAVYPGQQLAATVTVTNESLAPDVFAMTNGSGAWTLNGLPASLNMAGGEGQSRPLTLTVPADAGNGAVYVAPISATGQTGVYAMQAITATVSRPDALVVTGADNQSGRPGETLTYTLSLTNGAAIPITFDLTTLSGWPVSLPASLTVGALSRVDFVASMPVLAGAANGETNAATITAAVKDFPAITVQAVITGTANRVLDGLTLIPPVQTALPSQAVVYSLVLANGSGITDTFDLTVTSAWPVSLPGSLTVGGGSSVTVPLTILTPGGVISGTTHTATLTAASQANAMVQLSGVVTTVVSRADRLKTTLLPPARVLNVPAGQSITTSATLWYENNSNYPDDLAVTYTLPSGWTGAVSAPLNFSLEPIASRLGGLALTIPETVSAGAYQVPMTITGKHQQETVTFDVVIIQQAAWPNVYLPLIQKGDSPSLPDLVGSFTVVSGAPVVTVENVGEIAARDFWVDFYVDPSPPPTGPNQPWDYLCSVPPTQCQGLAWYLSVPIPPGGRVTLTPAEAYPPNSRWSGVSGAHEFYLSVDSWNPTVAAGAVPESDEGNNLSYQALTVGSMAVQQQQGEFEPVAGRVRRVEQEND